MTEEQNAKFGVATMNMLQAELSGNQDQWQRAAREVMEVQSERLAALEQAVAAK